MIAHWISAARIKTLPVCLCPVVLSLSICIKNNTLNPTVAIATIFCVLMIQIATNFTNDYIDFIKGADNENRIGPQRMTSSGNILPKTMKKASIILFSSASIIGLYLIAHGGIPILVIGVLSLFFGVIYTAGPFALAYIGGGEFVSMLFFGPISVLGTYYLQTLTWDLKLLPIGFAIGLITAALLVVNNTRDIQTDKAANKKTFAVRFGRLFSRIEYIVCLYLPIILLDYSSENSTHQMMFVLFLVFIAMLLTRRFGKATNQTFNKLLGLTSSYLVLFTTISIYLLNE